MQNSSDVSRPSIQAIARAASVLRALHQVPDGLALGDLAAAVALPKSTVHRLVAALEEQGLVISGPRIVLGPELSRLGTGPARSLPDALAPLLAELRTHVRETVDLAVLDGATARFVTQFPAAQRLRAVSAVGERFPLHCTANGKALLAALAPAEVVALLPARLPRLTPATITSRARLLTELELVREAGFAVDREEHSVGICAVGAVVRDGREPVAAISIPVPALRFGSNAGRYGAAVRAAAAAATELLRGV